MSENENDELLRQMAEFFAKNQPKQRGSGEDFEKTVSDIMSKIEKFSENHPDFRIGTTTEVICEHPRKIVQIQIQSQSFSMTEDELRIASEIAKKCTGITVSTADRKNRGYILLNLEVK